MIFVIYALVAAAVTMLSIKAADYVELIDKKTSLSGAFIGGILLGLIETFTKAYITTNLSDAVVFAVLIIVLLVKPAGLLGKYVPEKV